MISPRQRDIFVRHYATPAGAYPHACRRVSRGTAWPVSDAAQLRASFRQEFGVSDDDRVILCIGSGFKTKGLDRSLQAFAALPGSLQRAQPPDRDW